MCLDFRCMAGLSDSYPSQGTVSHLSQHQAAGVLGEEPNLRENKPHSSRGTCVHTEPCVTSAGVRAVYARCYQHTTPPTLCLLSRPLWLSVDLGLI